MTEPAVVRPNRIKRILAADQPSFGLIATIPSIQVVQVLGLDRAFIGPGDLATALEVPGEFENQKFKAAVAEAEAGILRSGVPLGGVARTPDDARRMLDRGYRALVLGFDWMLLQRAVVGFLDAIRSHS